MRRTLALIFALILISLPTGQARAGSTPADVVAAINAYRAESGIYPLAASSELAALAQAQSDYQASIQTATHTGAGDTTARQRALSAGYGAGRTIFVEEIIFSGQTATTAAAMDWWKSSSQHNGIMLSTNYHQIGAGEASAGGATYITVVVGRVVGGTTALPFGAEVAVPPLADTPAAAEVAALEEENQQPDGETPAEEPADADNAAADPAGDQTHEEPTLLQNPVFLWAVITILVVIILVLIGYILLQQRELSEVEEEGEPAEARTSSVRAATAHFDSLTHEEQYDLMEELAEKALSFYDLDLLGINRLQYRLNATFQVEARPRGAGGPRRYMLRISAPGFHSQANVRSEMQWLRSIRDHTNLIVPDPLQTTSGDLVATVEHPGVPESRHCVLLHWLEGKAPYENLTPEIMEKVGRFMGQLHQHAAHFSRPEGFERKKWDLEGMMGETLDVPAHKARSALTTGQIETIEATGGIVNRAMQELGRDTKTFGLIHADLHERNYLLFNDEVRAIDFDTCGEGYYIYDLAVALSTLLRRRDLAVLKASLLNGYRQARELSAGHEKLITPFIAARLMTHTFWLAGHRDDRVFRETAPQLIERQVAFLRQFIQRMT